MVAELEKKEKKYMFVLSSIECRLFRHLRKLETESDPNNMILEGTDPKLDKTLKLTFEFEGRNLGSFDIAGLRLVEECASASVQVVQALLNADERAAEDRDAPVADDIGPTLDNQQFGQFDVSVAADTEDADKAEVRNPTAAERPLSWGTVKRRLVPHYVKTVGFSIAQHDLTAEHRADLNARFPDVQIFREPVVCDYRDGLEAQTATDMRMRQVFAPDTTSIVSTNCVDSSSVGTGALINVQEVTPAISQASRTILNPSETAAEHAEINGTYTQAKTSNSSSIVAVAQRIGLTLSDPDEIHSMWLHWQSRRKVRHFAASRGRSVDRFHHALVTLYILAYHDKQYDLCFATLVVIQVTNYKYQHKMPDLVTAILAFQYLPEDNGLCQWIAITFAFLWGTQEYKTCEDLLSTFPQIDKDAFASFIFAIAHIRDPFTKGHDTAVLDQWCRVHRHGKHDAEADLCKEERSSMNAKFEEIRSKEAEDEYNEAKRLVHEYEETLRSQPPMNESTPVKNKKRKAGSSAVPLHKKRK